MQVSVATAMGNLYPVSQSKLGSFQPQQQLEASVADSFTPSTPTAQARSGMNFKKGVAAFVTSSLFLLGGCGQQVVEKVTPTAEKTVEKTAAAELSTQAIMKRILTIRDSAITPIKVKLPQGRENGATMSKPVNVSSLTNQQRINIADSIIKASNCKANNVAGVETRYYTLGDNDKVINSYPTLTECGKAVYTIASQIVEKGSASTDNARLDLQQEKGSTGNEGMFINVINGSRLEIQPKLTP
ncbi:MAG: hypothetical protein H2174_09135 [Vampirovibrio sp.]|nr:hypothetical protein [Vampirovibrio sp.]